MSYPLNIDKKEYHNSSWNWTKIVCFFYTAYSANKTPALPSH